LSVKQIGIYNQPKIQQILREAARIAWEKGENLKPEDFQSFDQLHYEGNQALEAFARQVKLGPQHRVVDVGAGVGGSCRHLAFLTQCRVTALEYLSEMAKTGWVLNRLQKLDHLVTFLCCDVTQINLEQHNLVNQFDALISQLAMLHIHDKDKLFKQCSAILKPGGHYFIEDYYLKEGKFDEEEQRILVNEVSVPEASLLNKTEYEQILQKYGLQVDQWIDKTEDWTLFVWKRYEEFLLKRESAKDDHGADYTVQIENFYNQVAYLFHFVDSTKHPNFCDTHPKALQRLKQQIQDKVQKLGGVRIIGHKINQ